MTYYIKGGSKYNEASPNVWVINHLSGYVEGHYVDDTWKDLNDSGAVGDPFWRLGGEGGQNWAEIGLSGHYRIKIDENGISGFDGSDWTGLMGTAPPASSLDAAFNVGKEITGATSLANAVLIGDGTDKFAQYTAGGIPHSEIIDGHDWHWESADGYVIVNDSIVYMEKGCTVTQVQAAIDAMSTAGGGIVQLPEGIIAMGATILVMKDGVRLLGAGKDRTIFTYTGNTYAVNFTNADDCEFAHIKTYNTGTGDGLYFFNSNRINVHHCFIASDDATDGSIAINSPNGQQSYELEIYHCYIKKWTQIFYMWNTNIGLTYIPRFDIHHNYILDIGTPSSTNRIMNSRYSQNWNYSFNYHYYNGNGLNFQILFRDSYNGIFSHNNFRWYTSKPAKVVYINAGFYVATNDNIIVGFITQGINNSSVGGSNVDNIQIA